MAATRFGFRPCERGARASRTRARSSRRSPTGERASIQAGSTSDTEASEPISAANASPTELEEERRRLVAQLRGDLAGLSVLAAERILRRSVDPAARKEALEEFLKDLDGRARESR